MCKGGCARGRVKGGTDFHGGKNTRIKSQPLAGRKRLRIEEAVPFFMMPGACSELDFSVQLL